MHNPWLNLRAAACLTELFHDIAPVRLLYLFTGESVDERPMGMYDSPLAIGS